MFYLLRDLYYKSNVILYFSRDLWVWPEQRAETMAPHINQ